MLILLCEKPVDIKKLLVLSYLNLLETIECCVQLLSGGKKVVRLYKNRDASKQVFKADKS